MPVAGGLAWAARRARALGCECIQLFGRNPRGWRGRRYTESEIASFRKILDRAAISPPVIHSCYLVNLASPDRALRHRSLRSVADDIVRAAALGGQFVVLHFGHHLGAGRRAGVRTVAAAVRTLLSGAPCGVGLLLENSAGRGSEMGAEWSDFASVLDMLGGDERIGVCFDTCHSHAAGHRVDSARSLGRTLRSFDAVIGLSRLRLIHLNDSRAPAGLHIDHHEHIGLGTIGDAGFRALLGRRKLQDRCAILETPIRRPGDDRRNLRRVKLLRDG